MKHLTFFFFYCGFLFLSGRFEAVGWEHLLVNVIEFV